MKRTTKETASEAKRRTATGRTATGSSKSKAMINDPSALAQHYGAHSEQAINAARRTATLKKPVQSEGE